MEISFPDAERQRLFNQWQRLVAQFGPELAELISCRLGILEASPCLSLLPTARPIQLQIVTGVRGGFSVALDGDNRLYFRVPLPRGSPSGPIHPATGNQAQIFGVAAHRTKKVFQP